jgi:hypothetical protein
VFRRASGSRASGNEYGNEMPKLTPLFVSIFSSRMSPYPTGALAERVGDQLAQAIIHLADEHANVGSI